jgi:hypothetical protein
MSSLGTNCWAAHFNYVEELLRQSTEKKVDKRPDLFDSKKEQGRFINKSNQRIMYQLLKGDLQNAAPPIYRAFYRRRCYIKETILLCNKGIIHTDKILQVYQHAEKNRKNRSVYNIAKIAQKSFIRRLEKTVSFHRDFNDHLSWFEIVAPRTNMEKKYT